MGHLFVVQADLTKLVVDDVIVPCDAATNFHPGYAALFGEGSVEDGLRLGWLQPGTFRSGGMSYVQPKPAPTAVPGTQGKVRLLTKRPKWPRVWLVDTALVPTPTGTAAEEIARGDDEAERAARELTDRIVTAIDAIAANSRDDRRQVLGMPLLGVSGGGFGRHYAQVVRKTLAVLHAAIRRHPHLDIVLVPRRRADYAAVQHVRRESPVLPDGWEEVRLDILRLADLAEQDMLVPFIGAGASTGAGLKSWWDLLKELAAGVDLGVSFEDIDQLDARDAALLILSAHPDPETFRATIAAANRSKRYPLTQTLIASLRTSQALTTNFDTMYETAFKGDSQFGDDTLLVLPREPYLPGHPWLMKLHGDIERPDTIVFSRDDYIQFEAESVPMASVVQATMLTKHLLFVGYSVSDENIVRLARQVVRFRAKHRRNPSESIALPVGTVLVPKVKPLKQRLWQGVLQYVDIPNEAAAPSPDPDERNKEQRNADFKRERSAATRNVDVFLDLLGMHACVDAPYFLVDRYQDLLPPADAEVAACLRDLERLMSGRSADSVVAKRVRRLLRDLGSGI